MKLANHRIFYIIKGRKIVEQSQYMFKEKKIMDSMLKKKKDTVLLCKTRPEINGQKRLIKRLN